MTMQLEDRESAQAPPAQTVHVPAAGRRGRRAQKAAPYLLIALPVTLVVLALGYPLVQQLIMSFQQFGLAQQFGQPADWVGLDNYAEIATDPYFWLVLLRSLLFCFLCAGLTMLVGVALAVLMQHIWPAARLALQIGLVLAWATPTVAALTVWQLLVDQRNGLVNEVLTGLGLSGFQSFNWLHASPFTFWAVAGSVIVWASVPLVTLSTFAALTQVDPSLVEAAQLDGAGLRRQLASVVLPLVRPVILLLGILQIIWDLRVFTQIHVLQRAGGDATQTHLLGTYVYNTGIAGGDYGMASALAMVMLAVLLVITWRYVRQLGKQGDLA
ncbi:sugar ABC transporter permease [Microbacterium betulae]|uniref:Sugar ABC transporter permease n=1 Tax=Microbacterium betulae TaxID=2981139 RepID=A0AA97FI49_9MICO|nr:sugar ABC transporter permease [Microbacterium sp. AB]WOF24006.1 sugar ABC transporter permease [Microbacterium sp. AB]